MVTFWLINTVSDLPTNINDRTENLLYKRLKTTSYRTLNHSKEVHLPDTTVRNFCKIVNKTKIEHQIL